MEYTEELTINLPRERVIELFDNPDNLPKWQEGLQSFELISGEEGMPGAKSRLIYDMGKRKVEMVETIEVRSLPDEFTATYEAKGVWNWVANRFYREDQDRTRWELETEFRMSGFLKIMGWLNPGAFRKETRKGMESFKAFAEGEGLGTTA